MEELQKKEKTSDQITRDGGARGGDLILRYSGIHGARGSFQTPRSGH